LDAGTQGAHFNATVAFVGQGSRTKIFGWATQAGDQTHFAIKPALDILQELGLVGFDSPQVMTTCRSDLDRDLPLGMQDIPDDDFVA